MAIYEGKATGQISFPLGGIGAGCVGLGGNGHLIDWEIFNRPNKGGYLGMTHFAVRAGTPDGTVVDTRVLQGFPQAPYSGADPAGRRTNFGFGLHRQSLGGLPCFRRHRFIGTFPTARVELSDPDFPAQASLEAFSPFIPCNDFDSSLPAAFFEVVLQNTGTEPLVYDIALSVCNPHDALCENRNVRANGAHKLLLGCPDKPEGLCVAVAGQQTCVQDYWYRGRWFDDINMFWRNLGDGGPLPARSYRPEQTRGNDHGTLMVTHPCAPGQAVRARFVIAWYYPIFEKYWQSHGGENANTPDASWVNFYATRFASAEAVADYCLAHQDRLRAQTERFRDALFGATLPRAAIEAASANLSILKTPTTVRLTDGSFYGWEGLSATDGCCEGSCTHVWNYQYALPFLFPKLERSMRTLDYAYNLRPDGGMPFRLQLPPGSPPHAFRPCCDGQLGGVMKVWREWKLSGDTQWMLHLWPAVKRSLEYAWSPQNEDLWDPEQMGVLTGRQHHTLDMELFGPNSWLTGFYLGALRAAAEMARAAGEEADAQHYEAIFERGRAWVDEHLFNGEYFIQKIDLSDKGILDRHDDHRETIVGGSIHETYWNPELEEINYQVGEGSAIDQVVGQWHASLMGLGDLFSPEKVRSALRAIYRHNYNRRINDTFNPCRLYCIGEEKGTMICAYPKGTYRPAINVPYAEETMHGFEYQAAIHMMMEGMPDEGTELIEAIRARYDGERRNPWNEFECGSNYARSMASYAVVPALSGFLFDATRGMIGFHPRTRDEDGAFRCPWSLDSGWGEVEIRGGQTSIRVLGGELPLRALRLPYLDQVASIRVDGVDRPFTYCQGEWAFAEAVTCMDQVLVQEG